MNLGTKVRMESGGVVGYIWAIFGRDNTCLVRYEKTNGKVWVSPWTPMESLVEVKE